MIKKAAVAPPWLVLSKHPPQQAFLTHPYATLLWLELRGTEFSERLYPVEIVDSELRRLGPSLQRVGSSGREKGRPSVSTKE